MMYRLVLLAALLLTPITSSAQKTQQILVVSDDSVARDRLVNVIKQHPVGVINVMSSLPSGDLNLNYDAIMMIRPRKAKPWLSPIDESRLYQYITGGGRFYAEGSSFRSQSKLWDFIGDSAEIWTSSTVHVDSVYGIGGTFAEGINAGQPFDPIREDALDGLHIHGSMVGVLGVVANHSSPIAWQASDTSIKAVLLWPIAEGYYEQFIDRVVCTYFQLCTLDVPKQVENSPKITFDPTTSEVLVPGAGNIVISDFLGREVLTAHTNSERYRLPKHLAKGSYILRWSTSNAHASVKIAVY
jgi:hypothetical protein